MGLFFSGHGGSYGKFILFFPEHNWLILLNIDLNLKKNKPPCSVKLIEKTPASSRYNGKVGKNNQLLEKSARIQSLYTAKGKGQKTSLTTDIMAETRHTTRL